MATKRPMWAMCLPLAIALGVPSWADNTVIGAGFAAPLPVAVAPGEVVTIFVQGIGSRLTQAVVANGLPLPADLAGISVSLRQSASPQGPLAVPLLAVFPVRTCTSASLTGCPALTGITLQVPFELGVFVAPTLGARNVAQLVVTENGASGAVFELMPRLDRIHVLRQGDTILMPGSTKVEFSAADAIVTHSDGGRVTTAAPGKPGEVLVLWAVGLGQTIPAASSGQATPSPAPSAPVVLAFNFMANAEPSRPTTTPDVLVQSAALSGRALDMLLFSGLTPGSVGLYQVNFVVPSPPAGVAPCGGGPGTILSNLTISIGRNESFDGAGICVAVSQ